ncbi:MAG TPA: lipid A deacylase LpxR family protein [Parvularculaceae bacterium]|nr:lipid A deacylase LpxR family protein [Parvularculaceae bacterium]
MLGLSVLACAALLPTTAGAQSASKFPGVSADPLSTWSFVVENDYFANTDENYTNGLRLSYVSGEKEPRGVLKFIASTLLGADEDARVRQGFALGQSIFTPQDLATATPLPTQHPYAGWLYGEYMAVVQQDDTIDQFTIQAGIIGPSAGGEFVQNHWHTLIGGETAKGWANQIGDEPGLILSYDHQHRALVEFGDTRFGADVTPTVGFSVGNIQTNARIGMTIRIGRDLTNDYGPPRVRPSLAGAGYFSPAHHFSWYLFAGAEARAIAYDAFLDGRLFHKGDPHVSSKVFVGDFQAGLVTQIRRVQIAYTYVVRTDEFTGQGSPEQFAAISLSSKF